MASKSYGLRRGKHYVYANRETRLGRLALVFHPSSKQKIIDLAELAREIKMSEKYLHFPMLEI